MLYETMEQHVGHKLTIGIIHDEDQAGTPVGLSLDCQDCDAVIEKQAKTLAEASFTKHKDEWCLKVENAPDLAPGTPVKVTVFKTGETKTMTVGHEVSRVEGKFPGVIYAAGEEL